MIELATETDAEGILDIYGPFIDSTTITFETERPTREEMAARIRDIGGVYPWLVSRENGKVTGYAYATRHRARSAYRWVVEASVYIDSQHHQKGLARALYEKLFEILRAQRIELVLAGITMPNDPSVRFHEKMGFEPIGTYRDIGYKQGAWRDVSWWRLPLRETPTVPPLEPLSLAEALRIAPLGAGR
jgi:L-amino acid N-acyltransferase YncA